MEFKEIASNVFHIDFDTREELAKTFVRFQEHFESPAFRGKIFTLKEYEEWYIQNSPKGKETGKFTYFSDWGGFNIPSEILEPFYKGEFDPLSEKEKEFLNLFRKKIGKKFYIIGTHNEEEKENSSLNHEIAHGLFFTNPVYKEEVLAILKEIDDESREEINNFLETSGGYHPDVWEDETHTYVLSGLTKLEKKGIDVYKLREFEEKLNSIFEKYHL